MQRSTSVRTGYISTQLMHRYWDKIPIVNELWIAI